MDCNDSFWKRGQFQTDGEKKGWGNIQMKLSGKKGIFKTALSKENRKYNDQLKVGVWRWGREFEADPKALEQWFSTRAIVRPPGDLWKYLETFFVVIMGEKVLLASSGTLWRSGMLPAIPYYTGHLPTTQNDVAQSFTVTRLRNNALELLRKFP